MQHVKPASARSAERGGIPTSRRPWSRACDSRTVTTRQATNSLSVSSLSRARQPHTATQRTRAAFAAAELAKT